MKTLFGIIFSLLIAGFVYGQKEAEVVVASTYLRKSPDYNSEKIQTLEKGAKVTLESGREASGWYFVSVSNGTVKGWIRSNSVRPLKEEKIERTTIQTPPQQPKPNVAASPSRAISASNGSSETSMPPAPVEEDNEVLRIETAEVSLYVRVVDDKNRPVNDLGLDDFKVFEDGVPQPITSLTKAEVPMINALVIDNSRSLRAQLKKVIEAGKIFVGANRAGDESSIVRFVSSDKIEVVQDFTQNKNALSEALDNLFVEGGQTAIIDAVYQTAKKIEEYRNTSKKDDAKLRALILVSDGDDRGSRRSEQELFRLLHDSNVQIYVVGFTSDLDKESGRQEKARDFLTRLAKETGGKVYFPESMEELAQIASDIAGELRTQYLISYAPTSENYDGSFRRIKVEVADGADRQKRTAVTRAGRNSMPK